ncbi:MAG TPA: pitrilysin family protein [Polyangiaceae bacterium]
MPAAELLALGGKLSYEAGMRQAPLVAAIALMALPVYAKRQAPAPSEPPPAVNAKPSAAVAPPPKPPAQASPPAAAAPAAPRPEIPFEKLTLANGLSVLLHRDPSLPLVAVNIWYHVGPRDEAAGRTGFAHLFEHLMFSGSRHVGREFDTLLESVGATNVNGTTSFDRTNYFETVPRDQLDLVLWIESDRMGYLLDVLDQGLLDVQRDVVKNERRQSLDNAPYGPSYLALIDALFPAYHPYNGAVIGSMADLSAATLEDVRGFFRDYYTPSNATLAIAGDFDTQAAKASIQKYFGSLTNRPKRVTRPGKLPPARPGRTVVEEPVELGQVNFGFRTPPAYSTDDPIVDVAMAVLAGGKATRLYQTLVVQKKLASDVSASQDSNQLSGITTVGATVATGKSLSELESALGEALSALERTGPSAGELERAKRRILVSTLQSLEILNGPGGESGRAGLLQRFAHYTGDAGYLPRWVEQIEKVSPADVQRVLREHLSADKRVTIVTQPRAKAPPPAPAPTKTPAPAKTGVKP